MLTEEEYSFLSKCRDEPVDLDDLMPDYVRGLADRGLIEGCALDVVTISDGVPLEHTKPVLKITERGAAMLKQRDQLVEEKMNDRRDHADQKTRKRVVRRGVIRDIIVGVAVGAIVLIIEHFPEVVREVVGWLSGAG